MAKSEEEAAGLGTGMRRFSGKADEGEADRTLTVAGGRRSGAVHGPQVKAIRRDGWTPARRKLFLETLAATCNVSEAARAVGKNLSTAYYHRRRDPAFARAWQEALGIGYAELETLLLRQSLFGSEQEELVLDGDGAVKSRKIRRGHPHMVGVRLLLAHGKAAAASREEEMRARADGEDAVERLRAALKIVRDRAPVLEHEPDAGNADESAHQGRLLDGGSR